MVFVAGLLVGRSAFHVSVALEPGDGDGEGVGLGVGVGDGVGVEDEDEDDDEAEFAARNATICITHAPALLRGALAL